MEKDKRDREVYKEVMKREQRMVDFRYKNTVLRQLMTSQFEKKLDVWSNKGFAPSGIEKENLELFNTLDKKILRNKENIRAIKARRVNNSIF